MAELKLYIDTQANQLVTGTTSTQTVQPSSLPLFYGDTLSLVIYLLTKTKSTTRPNDFDVSIVSAAGLQLLLYLNDGTESGTTYANQLVFTPDPTNSFFSANLSLNTPALLALVGSSVDGAQCFLKIGYNQNGVPTTVYSGKVTILVGIPTGSVSVPAGQTPISAETALSTFDTLQPVAGASKFWKTPNGITIGMRAVDNPDGTARLEPYIVT